MIPDGKYVAPSCRIGEHAHCHGPGEVRIPGAFVPVMTLRCGCPCHQNNGPRWGPH